MQRRQEGYDYILKHGPMSNTNSEHVIWADLECNFRPDSTIFGWQESRVKEILANKANSASGVRTLTGCPLYLRCLHPEILDSIVIPILSDNHQHGAWLCGETRRGKTQAATLCGELISAHNIRRDGKTDVTPSVTHSRHVDFWRLEPGNMYGPPSVMTLRCMAWTGQQQRPSGTHQKTTLCCGPDGAAALSKRASGVASPRTHMTRQRKTV